jgi:hypothetical protein
MVDPGYAVNLQTIFYLVSQIVQESDKATALTTVSRSSCRLTRAVGMYTLSFTNPQNDKSKGIRSGDMCRDGM